MICSTAHAYCMRRVISSISNLNRWSSSLRLFCHVPLKRDQMGLGLEIKIEWHSKCNRLYMCMQTWFVMNERQTICRHVNNTRSAWQMVSNHMKTHALHMNDKSYADTWKTFDLFDEWFVCMTNGFRSNALKSTTHEWHITWGGYD